jgi:hypothetical protein
MFLIYKGFLKNGSETLPLYGTAKNNISRRQSFLKKVTLN